MTDIKTDAHICSLTQDAIFAASDGDVRGVVEALHDAIVRAYNMGYLTGREEETTLWERDIDIIENTLNETLAD